MSEVLSDNNVAESSNLEWGSDDYEAKWDALLKEADAISASRADQVGEKDSEAKPAEQPSMTETPNAKDLAEADTAESESGSVIQPDGSIIINFDPAENTNSEPKPEPQKPVAEPLEPQTQKAETTSAGTTKSRDGSYFFNIARQKTNEALSAAESELDTKRKETRNAENEYNKEVNSLNKKEEENEKKLRDEKNKLIENRKAEIKKQMKKLVDEIDTNPKASEELNRLGEEIGRLDKATEAPIKEKYTDEEKETAIKNLQNIWEEINLKKEVEKKQKEFATAKKAEAKAEKTAARRRNVVDAFKDEMKARKDKAEKAKKRKEFFNQFGTKSFGKFMRQNQEQLYKNAADQDELWDTYESMKSQPKENPKGKMSVSEQLKNDYNREKAKRDEAILYEKARDIQVGLANEEGKLRSEREAAEKYEYAFSSFGEKVRALCSKNSVKSALRKFKVGVLTLGYGFANQEANRSNLETPEHDTYVNNEPRGNITPIEDIQQENEKKAATA